MYVQKFLFLSAVGLSAGLAHAQVTLDGTLGPAGPLAGPHYAIPADLGQQRGGNLFHSFGRFSIHRGESATFSGPASVNHIIGRVTGGQASTIDGALRSTISGASLYLLNPAGVLFGPNATLDVPGAVHVSTADYLRLGDGGRFDARTPGNSVLTVAPVEAFGFLGDAPGRIALQGSFLQVPAGETLSLIGGDIALNDATVYAPAGRLNVAAVGSAGEVLPTESDLAMRNFGALGTLTMDRDPNMDRVTIDMGEPFGDVSLADLDTSGEGGGAIFIRGGEWVSRGGWVFAETYGDQNGRGIHLMFTGETRLENNSIISTISGSTGNAGGIMLDVGQLSLSDSSSIFAAALDTGRGGDINVNADEAVTISGFSTLGAGPWTIGTAGTIRITTPHLALEDGSSIQSPTFGMSDGGSIEINVERLNLTGGSKIITSTSGIGNAGEIIITASEAVVFTSAIPNSYSILSSTAGMDSDGNAGTIRITTPLLSLEEGGGINSSTYRGSGGNGGTIDLQVGRLNLTGGGSIFAGTSGTGRGGEIIVNASQGVTIIGTISDFGLPIGGLSTNASDGSTGHAGVIRIYAPLLTLEEGGSISSGTLGAGNGGTINLDVERLSLTGGSTILTISGSIFITSEFGNGGNIIVNASEGVTITGAVNNFGISLGGLSTSAGGTTGNAGDIEITTPNLTLSHGGAIGAESLNTAGGNILLDVDHLKLLDGGAISASVFGDPETRGGDVTLTGVNFVALDGGKITATATQGLGGRITVNTEVFLHDAPTLQAVLDASSETVGNDGTVALNAPNIDLSGSLVAVEPHYLDATAQLSQRCGGEELGERSRFLVQGRGALPPDPSELVPANLSRCPPSTSLPPSTRVVPSAPAAFAGFNDH